MEFKRKRESSPVLVSGGYFLRLHWGRKPSPILPFLEKSREFSLDSHWGTEIMMLPLPR